MDSESKSASVRRSNSKEKPLERHKLFVTSLDGSVNEAELQEELKGLFQQFGQLKNITVRKNKNGDYSFAFVDYELGADASKAVQNLNGHNVKGKPMKVEFQDDSKRRKDSEKGCYNCGRMGHFARECRSKINNGNSRNNRGRSRSRSRSGDRKRRRRSPSQSSERERSHHKRKKQKKDRSRDKQEKKKKKHKKRRDSSSDSRS